MRGRASDHTALLAEAVAELGTGRALKAETLAQRLLADAPNDPEALVVRGLAEQSRGAYVEAERSFMRLTQLQRSEPAHWVNLGTVRRHLRRYEAALQAYATAGQLGEHSADYYYNVGLTHADRGDRVAARDLLGRALRLAPADPEILIEYATVCYEALDADEALATLDGVERLEGLTAAQTASVARLLLSLGEAIRAQRLAERVLATAGAEPRALLDVAALLERTNRSAEAEALLARIVADSGLPADDADLLLTHGLVLVQRRQHASAVVRFRKALLAARSPGERCACAFPMVTCLDALGRYAEAAEEARNAHAARVEQLYESEPLLVAAGPRALTGQRPGCEPRDVAAWAGAPGPAAADSPIFIVGFPRSGTTLLELALDAHPELQSMDEQLFLRKAVEELGALGAQYPAGLAAVSEDALQTLRECYWQRVRRKLQLLPGQRLVDKNPMNMLALPALRRLFPQAPILLALRHPCDVVLSCHLQHFRAPDFALVCSNLEWLATAHRRAFEYWYQQAELLRPRVREVVYESLVSDFENELRAIADFLGLSWSAAMLAPAERARERLFLSTPSYAQVMQPVTRAAIGRWRNYAELLAPIVPTLRPFIERWNYEV